MEVENDPFEGIPTPTQPIDFVNVGSAEKEFIVCDLTSESSDPIWNVSDSEKTTAQDLRSTNSGNIPEAHTNTCQDTLKIVKLPNKNKRKNEQDKPHKSMSMFELLQVSKYSSHPKKPPFSFKTLITMAIISSPRSHLTVKEICDFISNTFVFYRNSFGWQKSIRVTLMHDKFILHCKCVPLENIKSCYMSDEDCWTVEPFFAATTFQQACDSLRRIESLKRKSTSLSHETSPKVARLSSKEKVDSSNNPEEVEIHGSFPSIICDSGESLDNMYSHKENKELNTILKETSPKEARLLSEEKVDSSNNPEEVEEHSSFPSEICVSGESLDNMYSHKENEEMNTVFQETSPKVARLSSEEKVDSSSNPKEEVEHGFFPSIICVYGESLDNMYSHNENEEMNTVFQEPSPKVARLSSEEKVDSSNNPEEVEEHCSFPSEICLSGESIDNMYNYKENEELNQIFQELMEESHLYTNSRPPLKYFVLIILSFLSSSKCLLATSEIFLIISEIFPYYQQFDTALNKRSLLRSLRNKNNFFLNVPHSAVAEGLWSMNIETNALLNVLKQSLRISRKHTFGNNKEKIICPAKTKRPQKKSQSKVRKLEGFEPDERGIWEEANLLTPCADDSALEKKCKKMMLDVGLSKLYPMTVIITIAITLSPKGYLSLKGIFSFVEKFFTQLANCNWKKQVHSFLRSSHFVRIGTKGKYWTIRSSASILVLDHIVRENDLEKQKSVVDNKDEIQVLELKNNEPESMTDNLNIVHLSVINGQPEETTKDSEKWNSVPNDQEDSLRNSELSLPENSTDNWKTAPSPGTIIGQPEGIITQVSSDVPETNNDKKETNSEAYLKMEPLVTEENDTIVKLIDEDRSSGTGEATKMFEMQKKQHRKGSSSLFTLVVRAITSAPKGYVTFAEICKYINRESSLSWQKSHYSKQYVLAVLERNVFIHIPGNTESKGGYWTLHPLSAAGLVASLRDKDQIDQFKSELIFQNKNENINKVKCSSYTKKEHLKKEETNEIAMDTVSDLDKTPKCIQNNGAALKKLSLDTAVILERDEWIDKLASEYLEREAAKLTKAITLTTPDLSTTDAWEGWSAPPWPLLEKKCTLQRMIENLLGNSEVSQKNRKPETMVIEDSTIGRVMGHEQTPSEPLSKPPETEKSVIHQSEGFKDVNPKDSFTNFNSLLLEEPAEFLGFELDYWSGHWRGWDSVSTKRRDQMVNAVEQMDLLHVLRDCEEAVRRTVEEAERHRSKTNDQRNVVRNMSPEDLISLIQQQIKDLMQLVDNSASEEPPFSFTVMIVMALVCSPEPNLTLSDMFHFIQDRFPYYQSRGDAWKQSIQLTVSLNGVFTKACHSCTGRKLPDHGGCWSVEPLAAFQILERALETLRNKIPKNSNMPIRQECSNTSNVVNTLCPNRTAKISNRPKQFENYKPTNLTQKRNLLSNGSKLLNGNSDVCSLNTVELEQIDDPQGNCVSSANNNGIGNKETLKSVYFKEHCMNSDASLKEKSNNQNNSQMKLCDISEFCDVEQKITKMNGMKELFECPTIVTNSNQEEMLEVDCFPESRENCAHRPNTPIENIEEDDENAEESCGNPARISDAKDKELKVLNSVDQEKLLIAKQNDLRKTFTCNMCDKQFSCSFVLKHHKYFHTNEKTNPCYVCHKVFASTQIRWVHMVSKHQGRKNKHVVSTKCQKLPRTRKSVDDTPKHRFRCPKCVAVLPSELKLSYHVKMCHSDSYQLKCNYCNPTVNFCHEEDLKVHLRTEHPDSCQFLYVCDYCGAGFYHKSKLSKHLTLFHTPEKKPLCTDSIRHVLKRKDSDLFF